jgi:hypothetical protein
VNSAGGIFISDFYFSSQGRINCLHNAVVIVFAPGHLSLSMNLLTGMHSAR